MSFFVDNQRKTTRTIGSDLFEADTSSNPEVIATVPTRRTPMHPGCRARLPLARQLCIKWLRQCNQLRTAETAAEGSLRYRSCVSAGAECAHGCI